MEEKLFVKRRKKWLNITSRQKRRMKQENPCLRGRADMRSLADLAGSLVLSFLVGVGGDLGNKSNKQQRQTESKQPCQTSSRVWPINHLEF